MIRFLNIISPVCPSVRYFPHFRPHSPPVASPSFVGSTSTCLIAVRDGEQSHIHDVTQLLTSDPPCPLHSLLTRADS